MWDRTTQYKEKAALSYSLHENDLMFHFMYLHGREGRTFEFLNRCIDVQLGLSVAAMCL